MVVTLSFIFIIGYLLIAFEQSINLNKAASALLTGVLCWTILIFYNNETEVITESLAHHLSDISGILFFLLGAMTIVELIDAHDGFQEITDRVSTTNTRKLLWIVSLLAFFLSAVLDNLTTAIVMVSLTRKLISHKETRLLFAGMIVIASNAGGVWSPIGDVTTTMLWIGGQITSANIIKTVFLPGLVCMLVPLGILTFMLKGNSERPATDESEKPVAAKRDRTIIFFSGLILLLLVPVFKSVTHLPPYMGILLGLGILWVISEIIHKDKDEADKNNYSVIYALKKIDVPSILFFLGILLSVAALERAGILKNLAVSLKEWLHDDKLIVASMGVLSSIVDNVPLVAAAMGMYDLNTYPTDSFFWEFLAYCTGTGGSILIIGSAAGVAAMGIEKINFFWYLKKIGWLALLGYISGAAVFLLF